MGKIKAICVLCGKSDERDTASCMDAKTGKTLDEIGRSKYVSDMAFAYVCSSCAEKVKNN